MTRIIFSSLHHTGGEVQCQQSFFSPADAQLDGINPYPANVENMVSS